MAAAITSAQQADADCLLKLEAAAANLASPKLLQSPLWQKQAEAIGAQCKAGKSLSVQGVQGVQGVKGGTGGGQTTKAAGGVTAQTAAANTANITYDPAFNNCVDSTRTLCADPDVMHFVRQTFSVNAGATLTVKTYNLQGINNSSPDTVLYLIKCDTSACEAGDIVEADDDGNGETLWNPGDPIGLLRDSKIELTSPSAGTYVAYVISFDAGSFGTTDLSITQAGGVNIVTQGTVFSGWQIEGQELRTGDIIAAARNPGPPSMSLAGFEVYHDSKLLALSTTSRECSNCGRAQFVDDTFYSNTGNTQKSRTYLAKMTVESTLGSPTDARVVVGVYDDGQGTVGTNSEYYRMNVRLAHLRRSTADGGAWSHAGATDSDQDGLTEEVEEQLGTCDSHTGTGTDIVATFQGCQQTRDWINASVDRYDPACNDPNWSACTIPVGGPTPPDNTPLSQTKCWTPMDTDHDGIADGAEFFAVVASCATPPSGPYRQASCTEPNPLTESCGPNDWCMSEPNAIEPLATPFYDHDPTAYDVYVEADHLSTSVGTVEAANAHQLSAAQLTQLNGMWHDDPSSCWDGSVPNTLCDQTNDRRYRINIHAYPGPSWLVGDDRFQEEIIKSGGAAFTRSHLFSRFDGAMRYAHVARYALAWHSNGAQLGDTDIYGLAENKNRNFWWANPSQTASWARALFSHELGHAFFLNHQHLAAPSASCCADGTACTTARPNWRATGNNAWTCSTVWAESPAVPTPMAYQYCNNYGMLAKGDIPTSVTRGDGTGCSQGNLRFSKGILTSLDEGDLANTWTPSAAMPEWQLRKRIQDLYCFRSMNSMAPGVTTNFALQPTSSNFVTGPYCDVDSSGEATACYVNWQGSLGLLDFGWTGLMDITSGRWQVGSPASNRDRLADLDEWSTMIALGRQPLRNEPMHAMCLYGSTFNGSKVDDDYCGWSETVTAQGVTANADQYQVNGCQNANDCNGNNAICRYDWCSSSSPCRASQACNVNVCSCVTDSDCYSGRCVGGQCALSSGVCSCSSDSDCATASTPNACVPGAVSPRFCMSLQGGASLRPREGGGQPWTLDESAIFDGTNDRVQLHGGANSRLEALSSVHENQFSLYFDFRFDGFDANETTHVVLNSSAFSVSIVRGTGQPHVEASVGGRSPLIWNGVEPGRWYRVVWSASKATGEHFFWVRPWDPVSGWYGDGEAASDCVWQSWSFDLPSPGDAWLGHDGSTDASRYFHGRLDNISLNNFVLTAKTSLCTQQL